MYAYFKSHKKLTVKENDTLYNIQISLYNYNNTVEIKCV